MKTITLSENDKITARDSIMNRLVYLVYGFVDLDSKQQLEVLDMRMPSSNNEKTD